MTAQGHKVASLHGAKDAAERDKIIDNFRDGKEKVRANCIDIWLASSSSSLS